MTGTEQLPRYTLSLLGPSIGISNLMPREEYYPLLDETERKRHERFGGAVDAGRFATARAILKVIVAKATSSNAQDVRIQNYCQECASSAHGAPHLTNLPGYVSISHSGERVAVAYSRFRRVGVDIEQMPSPSARTEVCEAIRNQALHESERRLIDQLSVDPTRGHLQLWSNKEAASKVYGDGLQIDFRQIIMPSLGGGTLHEAGRLNGTKVRPVHVERGYVAALAVGQPQRSS